MFYSFKRIFLSLFLVLGLYCLSFTQSNLDEIKVLSAGADAILVGKVTNQHSKLNTDKTKIYTDVTIAVEDYLKGNVSEKSVIVSHLGGEVGDVGELYSHLPKFKNDEEVLVFLKKDEKNKDYKVLNGEEGKITLQRDAITGEKITGSNIPLSSLKSQIKNNLSN